MRGFHLPPQFFLSELMQAFGLFLFLPEDCVYQTIAGMLNQAPGAHTHSNTQQHSAPVSDCQHRERDPVNHAGQHSEGETAEESGRQTSILSAEKKHTEQFACCVLHIK